MLAELDDLRLQARDELMIRSRNQTLDWAAKAYETSHQLNQTKEGKIFTSLPEDVFALAAIHLHNLCDRLPLSSSVLPTIITIMLSTIRQVQLDMGGGRLTDLENICAAVNDFQQMGDKWEGIVSEILEGCFTPCEVEEMNHDKDNCYGCLMRESLEAVSSELVFTFMSTAIFAKKTHIVPVLNPIHDAIKTDLFGVGGKIIGHGMSLH